MSEIPSVAKAGYWKERGGEIYRSVHHPMVESGLVTLGRPSTRSSVIPPIVAPEAKKTRTEQDIKEWCGSMDEADALYQQIRERKTLKDIYPTIRALSPQTKRQSLSENLRALCTYAISEEEEERKRNPSFRENASIQDLFRILVAMLSIIRNLVPILSSQEKKKLDETMKEIKLLIMAVDSWENNVLLGREPRQLYESLIRKLGRLHGYVSKVAKELSWTQEQDALLRQLQMIGEASQDILALEKKYFQKYFQNLPLDDIRFPRNFGLGRQEDFFFFSESQNWNCASNGISNKM